MLWLKYKSDIKNVLALHPGQLDTCYPKMQKDRGEQIQNVTRCLNKVVGFVIRIFSDIFFKNIESKKNKTLSNYLVESYIFYITMLTLKFYIF